MIFLSFNLCGFGGPTKTTTLKLLLNQVNLDVVFLQEKLVDAQKAKTLFLHFLSKWDVVSLNPNGRLGGILSGWNPSYAEFCAYGTSAGILLEGKFKQSVGRYKLLNCYAPYKDKELFWQPIIDSGLLCKEGLIVGGDLKFTLIDREV